MDKVHLCLATVTTNGVVGGRVDVPAEKVESFVVVCERRVRCQVIMTKGKGRSVAPVAESASDIAGVVVEGRDVVERQAVAE